MRESSAIARVECDRPVALGRLGAGEVEFTVHADEGLPDLDACSVEVEILPPQPQQLALLSPQVQATV